MINHNREHQLYLCVNMSKAGSKVIKTKIHPLGGNSPIMINTCFKSGTVRLRSGIILVYFKFIVGNKYYEINSIQPNSHRFGICLNKITIKDPALET